MAKVLVHSNDGLFRSIFKQFSAFSVYRSVRSNEYALLKMKLPLNLKSSEL